MIDLISREVEPLTEQEREYIANDVLAVKEAIAQLRAEGKICKIQCSSQNMKGDNNYENH